jgi:hypothetical protein
VRRDLREELVVFGHVDPVDAVQTRQLQAHLVHVACAYPTENLALELLAAIGHYLLCDLKPLVIDQRLSVDVCIHVLAAHGDVARAHHAMRAPRKFRKAH